MRRGIRTAHRRVQEDLFIPEGHKAVTTALPISLVEEIVEICKKRQMRFGAYLELALRAMPKEPREIFPETLMPFGKYKGSLAGDVAKADPEYVIWLHDNSNKIMFTMEVINTARDILDADINPDLDIKPDLKW